MSADTTIVDCLQLIQDRYLDVPGLRLTKPEVQPLWRLDAATCEALLDALIAVRFLRRTDEGAYGRAGVG